MGAKFSLWIVAAIVATMLSFVLTAIVAVQLGYAGGIADTESRLGVPASGAGMPTVSKIDLIFFGVTAVVVTLVATFRIRKHGVETLWRNHTSHHLVGHAGAWLLASLVSPWDRELANNLFDQIHAGTCPREFEKSAPAAPPVAAAVAMLQRWCQATDDDAIEAAHDGLLCARWSVVGDPDILVVLGMRPGSQAGVWSVAVELDGPAAKTGRYVDVAINFPKGVRLLADFNKLGLAHVAMPEDEVGTIRGIVLRDAEGRHRPVFLREKAQLPELEECTISG